LNSLVPIQLLAVQSEAAHTRDTLLKSLSSFEDSVSTCIAKLCQKQEEKCSQFAWHINTLFFGLDKLYVFSIDHDISKW
jgi:hypothetical protein